MPSKRFIVSGRVQGVFFRAGTRRNARGFDLTGFVRNLPDGSVEVIASGTKHALGDLESWLWEGTTAAKVEDVRVEDSDWDEDLEDFEIR